MPTESAEVGDMLHAMGREFGATTGRARRCGWFDAVVTRHAAIVNGIDEIAVTCLDGLDTVETIKVCLGYRAGLARLDYVPADIELLAKCEPVYAEFPGWKTSITGCTTWKQLPGAARKYLHALAELTGARLKIISVGPEREQTIFV